MNQVPNNANLTGQNLNPQAPPPIIYPQAQPVPIMTQQAPIVVPSPYVAGQPIMVQPQTTTNNQPQVITTNNQPQVIIIQEERQPKTYNNCCYCQGIKNSPCGCCDYPDEYCCFLVCMGYILMSLHYIVMCLCIVSFCNRCF